MDPTVGATVHPQGLGLLRRHERLCRFTLDECLVHVHADEHEASLAVSVESLNVSVRNFFAPRDRLRHGPPPGWPESSILWDGETFAPRSACQRVRVGIRDHTSASFGTPAGLRRLSTSSASSSSPKSRETLDRLQPFRMKRCVGGLKTKLETAYSSVSGVCFVLSSLTTRPCSAPPPS